jgi:hypothetical protein
MNVGAPVTDTGTGYRCQWCEGPCTIEENQRGACDECTGAWDEAAHRLEALLDQLQDAA